MRDWLSGFYQSNHIITVEMSVRIVAVQVFLSFFSLLSLNQIHGIIRKAVAYLHSIGCAKSSRLPTTTNWKRGVWYRTCIGPTFVQTRPKLYVSVFVSISLYLFICPATHMHFVSLYLLAQDDWTYSFVFVGHSSRYPRRNRFVHQTSPTDWPPIKDRFLSDGLKSLSLAVACLSSLC